MAKLRERLKSNIENNNIPDLTQVFAKYSKQMDVENVTLQDYLEVDNDVVTSDHPTDQDILDSVSTPTAVTEEENNNESDEENLQRIPSHKDVSKAFATLRDFFMTQDDMSDNIYDLLNELEKFYESNKAKKCRQNLITEFFSKQ